VAAHRGGGSLRFTKSKRSKRVCHQDVCLHAPLGAPARSTLRESESGAPPLVTFAWPRKESDQLPGCPGDLSNEVTHPIPALKGKVRTTG